MKFTCEKYLLSLAVATAGRAAASKSPIPAMEGLLIEAGHNVRVTGYDLKKGIYTTFEADVSAPGSVVINAKLFGDIVRKLPDGIVSVCSDENNAVNIACGNADYNISGTASDDFPDLPSLDYCSNLSLPQDTMARMIAETSFAISTNESRPVYTGALIEVDNNIMTMVAVDGYRLALRRFAKLHPETQSMLEDLTGEDLNGDGVVAPDVTRTDAEATAVELDHVDESATVEQEERK